MGLDLRGSDHCLSCPLVPLELSIYSTNDPEGQGKCLGLVRDAIERVGFNRMRPEDSLNGSIQNKRKRQVKVQAGSGGLSLRSNESRNKLQSLSQYRNDSLQNISCSHRPWHLSSPISSHLLWDPENMKPFMEGQSFVAKATSGRTQKGNPNGGGTILLRK